MRWSLFVFFCAALVAQTPPWPTTPSELSQANHLPLAQVESIVRANAPAQPLKVGEFRFAFLETHRVYLIATIDTSGRDLFHSLLLIAPPGISPRSQVVESAPPHLLASELLDLDGSGVLVMVVKELIEPYHGAQTVPLVWSSLYRVQNGHLTDVSRHYPSFYQTQIFPAIALLQNPPGPDLLAYLQFKYQRIRDGGDAGITAAKNWMASPDPQIQLLAVKTLADIPTPASTAMLRELSRFTDAIVAGAARSALQNRARP